MLASALLGMVAGSRSLREVEPLTDELTPAVRTELGIARRVPDTTLRDALAALEPDDVRPALHAAARAAQRRKTRSGSMALAPVWPILLSTAPSRVTIGPPVVATHLDSGSRLSTVAAYSRRVV